ncbi:HNH endonuclease [Candidatus Saccharibacteria bacterium]|nr:HNH endonuclease [Candidatus Saccharibacteria bacterium]NCU40638.1 HNH endonuclease [Candidatus Saccharibacteria bacterium]
MKLKPSSFKLTRRTKYFWLRLFFTLFVLAIGYTELQTTPPPSTFRPQTIAISSPAGQVLNLLPIKGRAPKTGYERELFSNGWDTVETCDIRNLVLARDLTDVIFVPNTCKVASGVLNDPYTGNMITFERGQSTSDDVQIDHVVALSDAWQKGAQSLSPEIRHSFANDPLNLLAVDGNANQQKADSDAATWLPKNKSYRCPYVARQIAVKHKYSLWITQAEQEAMINILKQCPEQTLPL